MEKPTAVVAEMYELFGVEVRPKYSDRGSSICSEEDCNLKEENNEDRSVIQRSFSDEGESGEEDFTIELARLFKKANARGRKKAAVPFATPNTSGSSSIFGPGLNIHNRKRVRDSEEGRLSTLLTIC